MPRRKPEIKLPASRPLIPIDWNRVDKFLESGCTGIDIAGSLGCSADTLYSRCMQEKEMTFTAYSVQKKSSGDNLIRVAQMNIALKGNASMLIWLGKNRLGQKDDPYQESVFNGTLALTLDEIMKMKKLTNT
jgi:hypothetical protein